jgi:iron(III) transport system substrate-binding protein
MNYEHPVKAGAPIHPIMAALGPLEVDPLPLTDIARLRAAASKLVDKVGFDQ